MHLWIVRAIEEMFYLDGLSLDSIKAELSKYYGIDLGLAAIGGIVNSAFDGFEELYA